MANLKVINSDAFDGLSETKDGSKLEADAGERSMGQSKYKLANRNALDRLLLGYPNVTSGVIFGLPCYKINGKVFATLYGDGVGICVPEARVQVLLEEPHISEFRPYGKNRGKDHIQINHELPEEYKLDEALFLGSRRK